MKLFILMLNNLNVEHEINDSYLHKIYNLKHLEMIHMDVKPYTCETCHKEFTLPLNLKENEVIHTGAKP